MNRRIILGGGIAVLLIAIVGVAWLSAAPAIGPIAATPAYVVMNVPTQVVVTAVITDTSVITNGVSLLKIDNSGKTLATLGTMRDDGLNGDGVAGDKVFSLRTTVTEPSVGQLRFRVSAAFRGVIKRVLSDPIVVTVDPLALPPDPGDIGKQTLEGIDSDDDGIRDDVQRYIALNYFSNPPLVSALRQLAFDQQAFITVGQPSESELFAMADRRSASIGCLQHVTGGPANASEPLLELRAVLLNTQDRSRAFALMDSRFSGHFFPARDPARRADGCRTTL